MQRPRPLLCADRKRFRDSPRTTRFGHTARCEMTQRSRLWGAAVAALLVTAVIPTVVVASGADAAVPAPPTGFSTVWSEDFSGPAGSGLNTGDWLYDTGTSYPGGAANWGTGEVERMTSSTANVST